MPLNADGRGERGGRRVKRREHSVAGVLDDPAAFRSDSFAEKRTVHLLQRVGGLFAEPRARCSRAEPSRS